MDCHDCEERLYAFLDAELSPAELDAVRRHVEGCTDCGGNFGFEAHFLDQLRECCTSDTAPADLRRRVIAKLRTDAAPSS